MKMPLKAMGAIALSALTVACSTNQNSATATLFEQCQSTTNPVVGETSISGLTYIGSAIADAPFDSSAAEIVSYDNCTDKLYVVNAQSKQVDVLTFDAAGKPTQQAFIDLQSAANAAEIEIGAANSVATYNGLIAVAIENANKQENGLIALYRSSDLSLLTTYPAGALPDMVSFSPDGRYIASANEGEPSKDYKIDPQGSITLIDLR
ncbi:alkaline phosphatase, partial [Vibrio ichthyoenteri ATCC 700023]